MSYQNLYARNKTAWKMLKSGLPLTLKKRTPFRRYKKSSKSSSTVGRYLGPFSGNQIVNMRYCAYKSIDPAAGGALTSFYFRANGIYDPDVAVGGGQPLGRDQWATVYNQYCVLASKITVRFEPTNGGGIGYPPVVCGIFINPESTTAAVTWTTLLEQSNCKAILVQSVPGTAHKNIMTVRFNPKKEYSTKDVRDKDELCADVGSDPAMASYYQIFAGALDQASDPTAVHVMITIQYKVLFFDRKELPPS